MEVESDEDTDGEEAVPGEAVVIEGGGFAPESTVTVEITDEAGEVVAVVEDVATDETGAFTEEWSVPEHIDAGELTVEVLDPNDPDAAVTQTLTIAETEDADPSGQDSVSPSLGVDVDGVETEELTITGQGLPPGSTVTLEITDRAGHVLDAFPVQVDADGEFSVTWTVPGSLSAAELTLTAIDESGLEISGQVEEETSDPVGSEDSPEPTDESTDGLAATGTSGMLGLGLGAIALVSLGEYSKLWRPVDIGSGGQ